MIKKIFFTPLLFATISIFGQNTVFHEGFDTEDDISKWDNIDRDGDGEKWVFYDAEKDGMPAFSGKLATSWSYLNQVACTPDNILVSPVISLPETEDELILTFNVGSYDDGIFEEHYAVYVMLADSEFTGNEEPAFEETLDAGYTWTAKTINLNITDFKGKDVKLIFRHYDCTNIAFIGLDDIDISVTPGLLTSNIDKETVNIYPNPTTDFIHIKGLENIQKIRIFDMQGKIVAETKNPQVDVRQLIPGAYIVNVYVGNKVISRKLIKN